MKHEKHVIISFCFIVYFSVLLFILGINMSDFFKWLLIFIDTVIVLLIYYFVIKKISGCNSSQQNISEERKIKNKLNQIKKIISFLTYSFMIIFLFAGLVNNGDFYVKHIYPFFQNRFSNNKIFNWIIIVSPLCLIIAIYNLYHEIIKIIDEKYNL